MNKVYRIKRRLLESIHELVEAAKTVAVPFFDEKKVTYFSLP